MREFKVLLQLQLVTSTAAEQLPSLLNFLLKNLVGLILVAPHEFRSF
jgi:hypothetical protein